MAKETEGGNLGESLALSEAGLGTMTAAVGILSQLNSLLYTISKNPLAAPLAVIGVENQIGRVIQQIKKLKEEAKSTNQEFSLMKDPRSWMALGSHVLAIGLRLRSIRDEVEKTRVSLIKMGGERGGTAYGTGFEGAMGLTKAQMSMQYTYGKEFADQFKKTVEQMQSRVLREGMPATRQQKMFEVITGLSMATGVDYGRAISVLQDHMSNYKVSSMEALSAVDMIRDAWNKGDTAIGNLNDNIEAGTQLLTEFVTQGMRLPQATQAMLEMNQAANQLGLTTDSMLQMYRSTAGLREFGQQGIQNRLRFTAMAQQLMPKEMNAMLSPYTKQGLRSDEAMFAMQRMEPGKFMGFLQQYARNVIPTTKTGDIDWIAMSKNSNQMIKEFQMLGVSIEDWGKLLRGETVNIKQPADSLNDKLKQIADNGLTQFDSKLNAILEAAGTWQESLDSMAKSLGLASIAADAAAIALGAVTLAGGLLADIPRLFGRLGGGGILGALGSGGAGGTGFGVGTSTVMSTLPFESTATVASKFMRFAKIGSRVLGWAGAVYSIYELIDSINANAPVIQKTRTILLEEERKKNQGFYTTPAGTLAQGTPTLPDVEHMSIKERAQYYNDMQQMGSVPASEKNTMAPSTVFPTKTSNTPIFGMREPIVNQVNIYVDSEKIAARVKEQINHDQTTTPKALE